jgi:Secretion system C-terminal sorting domain
MKRVVLSLVLLVACAAIVVSLSSEKTGMVGQSAAGCTCHGASANTNTTILVSGIPSGAGSYLPGNTYAVAITVSNTSKLAAGLNLKVQNGTISNLMPGLQFAAGSTTEITHTWPQSFNGGTFKIFTFDWTAPATGGLPIGLRLSALATDGGLSVTGDEWNNVISFLPLGVEVTTFDVKSTANNVYLQWKTSSENNIKNFVVERSTNGLKFDSIGTVTANGGPQLGRTYSFDEQPKYTGDYHYRIRLNYNNATASYTAVKLVKFNNGAPFDFILYPNPSMAAGNSILNVNAFNCKASELQLIVRDIKGNLIVDKKYKAQAGTNYITYISGLDAGMYLVQVNDGNKRGVERKWVVQ